MSAAIDSLRASLKQARTSEQQYRENEEFWMKDALSARESRERYAVRASELEQAIVELGGTVEEVAA